MRCLKCQNKAIIELQHGPLCENHFIFYFEDKVYKTFKKYQMLAPQDKICVAVSGGKDSQTVLHLIKKYFLKNRWPAENIFALAIDEGISPYRPSTLADLKKFCKKEKIKLTIVSAQKEFGSTLDKALKKLKNAQLRPCHICGVWRRYLLNKYARKLKATKIITGHNLDDEAQATLMNLFKANVNLAAHLGPVSGVQEDTHFVQRIKPLYFCAEKETKLYSLLQKFPVHFQECPYAEEGYRAHIRNFLNDFEQKYAGTKQGIIKSYLHLLPLLKAKAKEKNSRPQACPRCGEAANAGHCKVCQINELLKNEN